jgi:hypothetical protein
MIFSLNVVRKSKLQCLHCFRFMENFEQLFSVSMSENSVIVIQNNPLKIYLFIQALL